MAFLQHNGRSICYRLLGDAANPLLILAHPLGMNQGVWDDMLPELLSQFHVLTWDLPGHGASAAWNRDTINPEDLASEALALADLAGRQRFHFAGTSIGGVIGQQLVSQHSDRLTSATLTNTGAVIGTPEAWGQRAVDVVDKGLAVMAAGIVPRWFGPEACQAEPCLIERWAVAMGRGDDRSYALMCEMLGRCDFREQFAGLNVPVLLIGGREDVATPPDSLQSLATAMGVAAPVILDHIGHVPSVECPGQLTQLLLGNIH